MDVSAGAGRDPHASPATTGTFRTGTWPDGELSKVTGRPGKKAGTSADPRLLKERRHLRQLATRIASVLGQSGARFVLLTSVGRREGKSVLMETLREELEAIAPERYLFVAEDQMTLYDPADIRQGRTVVVEGPSMLGGEGAMGIPARWMQSFDGALLIVMKRWTRRADMVEAVTWLRDAGIAPLGIVWNEVFAPPFGTRVALFWRRVFRPFGLFKGPNADPRRANAPR